MSVKNLPYMIDFQDLDVLADLISWFKLRIDHTRGEHANHYTTDVVSGAITHQ
jgi:hypothetical protein